MLPTLPLKILTYMPFSQPVVLSKKDASQTARNIADDAFNTAYIDNHGMPIILDAWMSLQISLILSTSTPRDALIAGHLS
jgi:hypothetical protein